MCNEEPYYNHSWKEITEINPNLIKIAMAYRFPMGTLLGIGGLV